MKIPNFASENHSGILYSLIDSQFGWNFSFSFFDVADWQPAREMEQTIVINRNRGMYEQ